jgi:protein-tyrosine phosphatase
MVGVEVLMVCHGNICRSPMAAAVASTLVEEAGLEHLVTISSAGTSNEHAGDPMDRRAADALRRHGWPVPAHRARQIRARDVRPGDLVLAADRWNLRSLQRMALAAEPILLRSFDPTASPGDDEVPDPWYDGREAFDLALSLIESACRGLVAHLNAELRAELGSTRGTATTSDGLAGLDPG